MVYDRGNAAIATPPVYIHAVKPPYGCGNAAAGAATPPYARQCRNRRCMNVYMMGVYTRGNAAANAAMPQYAWTCGNAAITVRELIYI